MVLQIPITLFAAVSGAELVLTILGPDWKASIPIFYALVPNLLASTMTPATQWVFLSRGDTARLVKIVAFNSAFILLSFVIGLPYGPVGVAWSFSITSCVLRVPSILYCFKPSPLTAGDFFPFMIAPTVCSLIAAASCLVPQAFLPVLAPWLMLGLKAALFALIYVFAISCTPAGRDLIGRAKSHIKQLLANRQLGQSVP